MLVMKVNKGSFTEATNDSHTKYISLPTQALLAENTILVMAKEDSDTCEPSLNSIMRAPPLPPELVSSLTQQSEKVVLLTENELAVGEGEGEGRGGGRGEDTAGGGGCGGDVGMLELLSVSFVIAVWLRAREPAVRKKRGVLIDDEDGVVPVMAVVLRLREGEFSERWKRMGVI
ncbi:uncharacterized protein MONOS_18461 [Monocercomonoides exilis]|uniref:uncharacterized protein n=1 Tax=Monocercomonoides exilis TaxID=2049356 RepID=UPI00355A05F7|nr:hypothetical protein MONOS_18461 [Monocercomonoides exilis]